MDAKKFIEALSEVGVRFFAGVPDSYLHGFCTELKPLISEGRNVIAANEGNAIGIATGYYLATAEVPLVYMQNSGLGNAVNPLASLACNGMLGIPMILLIGWRGDPYHSDHVQHELQGAATPTILDDLGISHVELCEDCADVASFIRDAVEQSAAGQTPVAILVPKGVLNGVKHPYSDESCPLSREEAIIAVLEAVPSDAIFSATTGRAARELFHVREARGEDHSRDYLNVGSMGHASSVALGIALAHPGRQVVCLDGDAAVIMHMGALAMASTYNAPNFLHVVLNNGAHESVGEQPSAGQQVDFTAIAEACGYETVGRPVSTKEQIADAIVDLCAREGAKFLDIHIHSGIRSDMPGLEVEPKAMRDGLMAELGCGRVGNGRMASEGEDA